MGGDILSFYELWWGVALKRLGNTALSSCTDSLKFPHSKNKVLNNFF